MYFHYGMWHFSWKERYSSRWYVISLLSTFLSSYSLSFTISFSLFLSISLFLTLSLFLSLSFSLSLYYKCMLCRRQKTSQFIYSLSYTHTHTHTLSLSLSLSLSLFLNKNSSESPVNSNGTSDHDTVRLFIACYYSHFKNNCQKI